MDQTLLSRRKAIEVAQPAHSKSEDVAAATAAAVAWCRVKMFAVFNSSAP